ncbi:sepiapterin reductase b [Sardina pilchardus]|uniref:sepiapterin reductase b n=1 Tax=Sardina pilchardus TaxID=27697 RepID=UPI002E1192E3
MECTCGIAELFGGPNRDLGQVLCIITGASRGYGRMLALQVSGLVRPGSALLLVARSEEPLQEVQKEIADSGVDMAGLAVCCVRADLSTQEGVDHTVRTAKEAARSDIDHMLLINNAGSLGDVSRFTQSFTDLLEVDSYLSLNVSSALGLTASLLQAFPRRQGLRRTVVNLSSLCAQRALPSWVLYCTGKAARDMMFRVLAEEEPDMKVLNYSPGPLDTDMQVQARYWSGDAELRRSLCSMFRRGQLLSCQESGAKLLRLLLDDDFPSGAHVDYYEL